MSIGQCVITGLLECFAIYETLLLSFMMHGLHFSIGVSQTSEEKNSTSFKNEIRLTHAYE